MIDNLAGAVPADSPSSALDEIDSLQAHFHEGIAPDEIEQVYLLKRAQPMLQVPTRTLSANTTTARQVAYAVRSIPHTAQDAGSSIFGSTASWACWVEDWVWAGAWD